MVFTDMLLLSWLVYPQFRMRPVCKKVHDEFGPVFFRQFVRIMGEISHSHFRRFKDVVLAVSRKLETFANDYPPRFIECSLNSGGDKILSDENIETP
jgi:hypothetical protein